MRPQLQGERKGPSKAGWSAYFWVTALCLSVTLLFWILKWCGVPAPRWVILTTWGVLAVLILWAVTTDKPTAALQDSKPEEFPDTDAPVDISAQQVSAAEARRVVVLPEGVGPASGSLRCAACQAGEVMVLPANAFSRRPGFICAQCGALMRPAGTTGAYVGVSILGGFILLLGAIMAIASIVNPTAFQENQLHGSVLIASMGALVGGWAIKQLRLATPLGATAQAVGRWPWIIALAVLLFLLLAVGGGMFFLMYYIQEML